LFLFASNAVWVKCCCFLLLLGLIPGFLLLSFDLLLFACIADWVYLFSICCLLSYSLFASYAA
jgi:type III secretory pathway component EscV